MPNDLAQAPSRSFLSRMTRRSLLAVALLAGAHLLVATPHFVVRLIGGSPHHHFAGVANFGEVDEGLWRGAAPTATGYGGLAAAGVVTVVDLRAEEQSGRARHLVEDAGMRYVHVPIRDGQTPTAAQMATVEEAITAASGIVFVHCAAGVGRTGSVVAALAVAAGRSPIDALVEAWSFGPISLEQQAFILKPGGDDVAATALPVVAASRLIDSPRRLWARLTD